MVTALRRLRAWWQLLGRATYPIHEGLPTVQVQRGGVRFQPPPQPHEPDALFDAVRSALDRALAEATANTPVDTGNLRSIVAAGGWCAPSELLYDYGPIGTRCRLRAAAYDVQRRARCWLADRIDPRGRWTELGATDDWDDEYGQDDR